MAGQAGGHPDSWLEHASRLSRIVPAPGAAPGEAGCERGDVRVAVPSPAEAAWKKGDPQFSLRRSGARGAGGASIVGGCAGADRVVEGTGLSADRAVGYFARRVVERAAGLRGRAS